MSTLTQARQQLAADIQEAVGGVPVWEAPPTNVTAPGVIVAIGAGTQTSMCAWEVELLVTVIGPGGDNLAGLSSLETLLLTTAGVCNKSTGGPASWERPGQTSLGGQTYLAATITVPVDVEGV